MVPETERRAIHFKADLKVRLYENTVGPPEGGPHEERSPPRKLREGDELLLLRLRHPLLEGLPVLRPRPGVPIGHGDFDLLARHDRRGLAVDRIDRLQALDEGEGIAFVEAADALE